MSGRTPSSPQVRSPLSSPDSARGKGSPPPPLTADFFTACNGVLGAVAAYDTPTVACAPTGTSPFPRAPPSPRACPVSPGPTPILQPLNLSPKGRSPAHNRWRLVLPAVKRSLADAGGAPGPGHAPKRPHSHSVLEKRSASLSPPRLLEVRRSQGSLGLGSVTPVSGEAGSPEANESRSRWRVATEECRLRHWLTFDFAEVCSRGLEGGGRGGSRAKRA